ncbi:MAG: hypothetical protein ACQEP1_03025 [Nanobdellota archaeon]
MLETRGWISLILGFITTAFGAIPLLNNIGLIGFDLPFSIVGIILEILLIMGGLFLLFDSAHEDNLKWVSVIVGLIIIILGAFPLVNNFVNIGFSLGDVLGIAIVKNIILIVSGILLIFGAGD